MRVLDEHERILADLGARRILVLRNHGLLKVGRSIGKALLATYKMEWACEMQLAFQQSGNLGVYVSPMTAWEIATLVAKSRLRLSLSPEAWFDALLGFAGVRLAPMPPKVLIASAGLPGVPPKDPVDRIIAATGRTYGYVVITRDGELRRYARAGHIELVEC